MRNVMLGGSLAIALLLAGAWLSYSYFAGDTMRQEVDTTVVLERMQKVCQLVTVKGQYAELYHDRNIREMTIYIPIPTRWEFSKEAMLEVRGTVLVGYDMEQVKFTIDHPKQEIRLSNLPEPAVLAIDHEIKYVNLEESFFNSFTPEDYTQLNKNAKEVLKSKAVEKGLLKAATEQGNDLLAAMELMAQSIGWTVVVKERPVPALAN